MNVFVKPLKRFGQNFLIDKNIIKKIIQATRLTLRDTVLEIGPGRGALTFELARHVKRLVAVELDRGLCSQLLKQTQNMNNLDVICCDILKFNLKSYGKKSKIKSFKVVANVPYYITTPILEFLFKNIGSIDDVFLTVQKEVAERMTAKPGTKVYGSLTCFVSYYCSPKVLFKIKRNSFWPVPKVDSCFIRLKPLKQNERKFGVKSQDLFFRTVRSAFGQRRKQLYASLSGILRKNELRLLPAQDLLSQRPEQLSLADFIRLSNLIFDFLKKR